MLKRALESLSKESCAERDTVTFLSGGLRRRSPAPGDLGDR